MQNKVYEMVQEQILDMLCKLQDKNAHFLSNKNAQLFLSGCLTVSVKNVLETV